MLPFISDKDAGLVLFVEEVGISGAPRVSAARLQSFLMLLIALFNFGRG